MKIVRRRLFNLCAATSLVLLLAAAVLWAHSYRADDTLSFGRAAAVRGTHSRWNTENWAISGEANSGRLVLSYDAMADSLNTDELHLERGFRMDLQSDRERSSALAGQPWFGWTNTFDGSEAGGEAALQFPLPLLLLLASLLPILALRRIARDRRRPESICRLCGYDCRATPERCPECGAGFAAAGS